MTKTKFVINQVLLFALGVLTFGGLWYGVGFITGLGPHWTAWFIAVVLNTVLWFGVDYYLVPRYPFLDRFPWIKR